jgi:hypothetical protein
MRYGSRGKRLFGLLVGILLALGGPVCPQQNAQSIGSIHVSYLSGWPDLAGLSVSVNGFRPLALEAGCGLQPNNFYARVGVARQIADRRNGRGQGWTKHYTVLGGYRFLYFPDFESRFDGASLAAQWQSVQWLAPHFGLEFQVTAGLMLGYFASPYDVWSPLPDLRIAIGLAF